MPTSHQAYRHTRLEGLFDHPNLLRRGPAPTALNRRDDPTRSLELVKDTAICLTLAKWETVSGRFGGYLMTGKVLFCSIRTNLSLDRPCKVLFACYTEDEKLLPICHAAAKNLRRPANPCSNRAPYR